jgi:transcription initiation factor IIE alpha subunit
LVTGAADGLLALIRKKGRPELRITGRDIESTEYALEFDSQRMCWNILGKAEDVQSSTVKQGVYDTLQKTDDILSPAELAELTGVKKNYVQKALRKLLAEGKITREDRGKYKYKKRG